MIAQVLAVACAAVQCASAHAQYTMQPYATGFDSPLYVAWAPGDAGRIYVVEKTGRVRIVRNGRIVGTLLDLRGKVSGAEEQGLLSIAFSPGYARNHRFYVSYTDRSGDSRVVEYRSANDGAVAGSARLLLHIRRSHTNHNGGQLQFDRNGYLYAGFGDGGSEGDPDNLSQNLSSRLGKLLRINPLRGGWQMVGYGLRNPWRFSFDRSTGDLWIGDVGQDTWEEIDYRAAARVAKLANYGWSRFEGKATYKASKPLRRVGALIFPVWVYPHDAGACSVTGGYVYRGASVPAAQGRYFFGDFCNGRIWSFKVGNGRASAPVQEPFSVKSLSSFGEDAGGELYATSLSDGTVYKLTP